MTEKSLSPDLLQSRQHFEILDGMRGVAALGVVIFHFMEIAISDYSNNFIGHGFLAVDFFFCLSGFVIAYAYDGRIAKMGIGEFFRSRIIRLHPLVFLGSVIGLLGFLFDPYLSQPPAYSIGRLAVIFLTSILLIPFPVMQDRFFNNFGFNAPAWSLFWEYIANIFYALVLYRLPRIVLLILAILSAGGVYLVIHRSGSIMGGWSGPTFWDGSARIAFSFLAGMLIYRFEWIIKNRLGFIGMSILLALGLLSPFSKEWNWLTESFVVLIYFPFIIALGAGATLNPIFQKLCVFCGNMSYPLYMTHYAALWIFGNYFASHKPAGLRLALIVSTSVILLVGFAYLVMVLYDMPVRKYLTARRKTQALSR